MQNQIRKNYFHHPNKKQPQYRFHYKQCTNNKNHTGQIMNFVCLNEVCSEHSLICSMCRSEKHQNHQTKPLKHYIESLKKQYQSGSRDYDQEVKQLQQLRVNFLLKLKQTVMKVAEQFRKLQEDVVKQFQRLKSHLIEQQIKKNKFKDFYNSLINQTSEKSQFLIQNYLPQKQLSAIKNLDGIQKLGTQFSKMVTETHNTLFDEKDKMMKPIELAQMFKLSPSVTKTNNLFAQTNFIVGNATKTMSIFKLDLQKEFKNSRIKIKVTRLKKGGYLYLGAIEQNYFNSLNHCSPTPTWNSATNNGKIYFVNNTGLVFGHSKSQLKTFSEGSNLQVTMPQAHTMKISMKKNSGDFILPSNKKFIFFFSLIGNTEIQLNYMPN